jgi:hypothetical protein
VLGNLVAASRVVDHLCAILSTHVGSRADPRPTPSDARLTRRTQRDGDRKAMKRSSLQMGDLRPDLRRRLVADVTMRIDQARERGEQYLVHPYAAVLDLIANDMCPITELICGLLPNGRELLSLSLVDELLVEASLETRPDWDRRLTQDILAQVGRADILDNRRINALCACRRYTDPRRRYARRQTHMVAVDGYTVFLQVTETAEGKWTYATRSDRLTHGLGLRKATNIEPLLETKNVTVAPGEPYYDRRAKRLLIQAGHVEYADLDLRQRLVSVECADHPYIQAMKQVGIVWV